MAESAVGYDTRRPERLRRYPVGVREVRAAPERAGGGYRRDRLGSVKMQKPEKRRVGSHPAALDEDGLLRAVEMLSIADEGLGSIVARHGPPPLWSRPQGFATLGRIILEQQVSLASAQPMFERVSRKLAGGFTPVSWAEGGEARLRALGVTRQKAAYLVAAARHSVDNEGWYQELASLPDERALERLRELRGVGDWTASIYLLMALCRPDIWPHGDLAVQKAFGRLLGRTTPLTSEESSRLALRWRPWRAVAARILWRGYLGGWR